LVGIRSTRQQPEHRNGETRHHRSKGADADDLSHRRPAHHRTIGDEEANYDLITSKRQPFMEGLGRGDSFKPIMDKSLTANS
jgi:hypothetical protein